MSSGVVDERDQDAGSGGEHGAGGEHGGHDAAHVEHPSDAKYIKIALILGVVTAVEVLLYYYSFSSEAANNAVLMLLAIVKFVIVAAYFMHLKFDNKIVRRLFITGLVLAIFCYVGYLLTMGVFR